MRLKMLKAKIHRVRVTQCDIHYEGSISVDSDWLAEAGILPYEQVDVLNINTGARFTTYAIPAEAGSRTIGINGAAARLAQQDDLVIIIAYAEMEAEAAQTHEPVILVPEETPQGPVAQLVRAGRS